VSVCQYAISKQPGCRQALPQSPQNSSSQMGLEEIPNPKHAAAEIRYPTTRARQMTAYVKPEPTHTRRILLPGLT